MSSWMMAHSGCAAKRRPKTQEPVARFWVIGSAKSSGVESRKSGRRVPSFAFLIDGIVENRLGRVGLELELELTDHEVELDPEMAIAVFRIVQESITNVLKHAAATRAGVSLVVRAGELAVEVWDNGVGIDPGRLESGRTLGLLGLRERASAFGGRVQVRRRESGGTRVLATFPLPGAG